jgi:hypothetical protein
VTSDKRLQETIFTTNLGPIVPLWGIIENKIGQRVCECRKRTNRNKECPKAGKHPRMGTGWQQYATLDPGQIAAWQTMYPDTNFGVRMGPRTIALDADFNPDVFKDGPSELELFQEQQGQRIGKTVTSISGRNGLSNHQFFLIPGDAKRLKTAFNAVDLIKNNICVAPGSKHRSGEYYHFADGCTPFEVQPIQMPDFLLQALTPEIAVDIPVLVEPQHLTRVHGDLSAPSVGAVAAGVFKPDWVVIDAIRRDAVAGQLFEGFRRSLTDEGLFDRSKDDFILASKLAFYTSHHWDQYVRLFRASGLAGGKNNRSGDYLSLTLHKAFFSNRGNWHSIKGLPEGRPTSPDTVGVKEFLERTPDAPSIDISRALGIHPAKVRTIRSRIVNGFFKR